MSRNKELKIIEGLINNGQFNEAQAKIESIEKLEGFSDDEKNEFLLLKGQLLCKIGKFDKSLELAIEVSEKTKLTKNILHMLSSFQLQEEVLWRLGRLDESLRIIKQAQEIIPEQEQLKKIRLKESQLLRHEGVIYWLKYNIDPAVKLTKQALRIAEGLGNKEEVSYCTLNLANYHSMKGELDEALEYHYKNLEYYKQTENRYDICFTESNIARIYSQKGQWKKALDLYDKVIKFFHEIDNQYMINGCYQSRGFIYLNTGRPDQAIKNGKKSLQYFKKMKSRQDTAIGIYLLIHALIEKNNMEEAQKYLLELKLINEEEEDKLINQQYRFVKARLLKRGTRITEKVQAQEILQHLVKEEIVEKMDHYYMMMNLCELLLAELKAYGEKTVLEQIKSLLGRMSEIATKVQSSDLILKTKIFEARLSLVDGDLQSAEIILEQAKKNIKSVDSESLKKWINYELRSMYRELSKWDDVLQQNLPLKERIDKARLVEYITQASRFVQEG